DDADVVFVRRLEFLASPCRQIDVCGKGAVAGDEQSEGKCSREDFHGGPPANLMLGLCSILLRRVQLNASFAAQNSHYDKYCQGPKPREHVRRDLAESGAT